MKIFFESQVFWWQRYGGISRYISELIAHFEQMEQVNVQFAVRSHVNKHLMEKGLAMEAASHFFDKYDFRGSGRLRSFLFPNKGFVSKEIANSEFDLLIPSYYDPYFLEPLRGRKFLLTVHDMIHELRTDLFRDGEKIVKNKKALIEKASGIICVSYQTKSDLSRLFPQIDPDNIKVVHHGHSMTVGEEKRVMKEKYILYVGSRDIYKQFRFCVEAIKEQLLDRNLVLLCAGGGAFRRDEVDFIESLGISDFVRQYTYEDHEAFSIYRNAEVFIFPSEYEGFGIPILEAMFAGCPVVLPSSSTFPEVAKEAGIYYHLNDAEDLNLKLTRALEDTAYRENQKSLGLSRVQNFSWQKTASEVFDFCQEIIQR